MQTKEIAYYKLGDKIMPQCEFCDHEGDDVEWTCNPYLSEIEGIIEMHWYCDACREQQAEEI